ncbi:11586_t:CDS:2, partial [Cetraspora pellucida]
EITLNGKDKFQFTKTPLEKLSKILLLAGNQMEIVGNIKHQVTSTKDSNSKAMKDLATKKMKTAYKEEKIKREQKKIQVIDPLPDPDVVKPKNQKTNRSKRKDVGVSYCVPASSSFLSNDDTSGVPLRKRVVHLIAATELDTDQLNTDQIVKKVKDSKENVQKVLDEVAEQTKKGTWKLTPNAWLTLEPYTWFSYGQKVVSGVVQKMNEIADSLGLPQDSSQRPRQPKLTLPPNHSTNIDVGEPSFRKRLKIASGSYSEVLQNNDISSGSFRGTKSTRGK